MLIYESEHNYIEGRWTAHPFGSTKDQVADSALLLFACGEGKAEQSKVTQEEEREGQSQLP